MHETAKCTMLELEIAFNDFFGCNSFNQTNSNSFKVLLVAHSTCVALGGLTYRGRSITEGTIKNPYVSKDLGILKHAVPEYIKTNRELMKMINSIEDASIDDGGTGAFYIYLKKKLTK